MDESVLAERYDCEALALPLSVVAPAGGAGESSPEEVGPLDQTADLGPAVNCWRARRWHEADRPTRTGVDGIDVDYPGLLEWVRSERLSANAKDLSQPSPDVGPA